MSQKETMSAVPVAWSLVIVDLLVTGLNSGHDTLIQGLIFYFQNVLANLPIVYLYSRIFENVLQNSG